MGETVNIGAMAEKISNDIFREFLWEMLPATNIDWKCVKEKEHGRKTHPSDVVFTYKEPYKNLRTYINTDLKSYSKGSISKSSVGKALESLAKAVACCDISESWQKLYKNHSENFQIHGLLFIYNHDGEYDKDFKKMLHNALKSEFKLSGNKKIFVLGPEDICYLNTIVNDIKVLRGEMKISMRDKCSFYYPDLITSKLYWSGEPRASVLECLTSPYQILEYKIPENETTTGLKLYYRRSGETVEEFIYLFDYLLRYQLLDKSHITEIEIRMPNPASETAAIFEAAKTEYAIRFSGDPNFSKRLDMINYSSITNVVSRFSEVEMGMRDDK